MTPETKPAFDPEAEAAALRNRVNREARDVDEADVFAAEALARAFAAGAEQMKDRAAAACDEVGDSYDDAGDTADACGAYAAANAVRALPLSPSETP